MVGTNMMLKSINEKWIPPGNNDAYEDTLC